MLFYGLVILMVFSLFMFSKTQRKLIKENRIQDAKKMSIAMTVIMVLFFGALTYIMYIG